MFKIKNKLSPPFICDLVNKSDESNITETEDGNLKVEKKSVMKVPSIKKLNAGTETLSFIGQKIWNSLTDDLKSAKYLSSFQSKIKEFDL